MDLDMPQPLKLKFRITLNEYLEFRRAEQSAFRLWLLLVADASWIPLSFLLGGSVLLVSLTLSRVISISFPNWLPLLFLVLLALCRIYLSVPSVNATRLAKSEWKKKIANQNCTLELTDAGFLYVSGASTYQPAWSEVGSVFQSEQLIILCDDDREYALLIPKKAFVAEEQLKEFLDVAYQKTVLDR